MNFLHHDTTLYFGNICILKYDNDGQCVDLDCQEWEKVYEELFGGFEDIGIRWI